jgi:hypothetical protein
MATFAIDVGSALRAYARSDIERRARARWEANVRASSRAPIYTPLRNSVDGAKRLWRALRPMGEAMGGRLQVFRAHTRYALIGFAVSAGAAFAAASAIAIDGYVGNPPAAWAELKASRRHSPIFDAEGRLAGSVGDPDSGLDLDAQRDLAFLPLTSSPPSTFVAGLKALEDRNFDRTGWRAWCGIDVPSMVWRWIASRGVAGGSGVVQQYTRLLKPEWGNEKGLFDKVLRKFRELGASCSVWSSYAEGGGADAILSDYASMAPMLQGGGTLRGLAGASHITFGVEPAELSDAQQLLFAAAVRLPLRLLQPGDVDVACTKVYPKAGAAFEAALAAAHPARVNQCRIIARATGVAPKVLQGEHLQAALADLQAMQRSGVHVASVFQRVPAAKLLNLTSRTAAMLPATVTKMLVNEVEMLPAFEWGQRLNLTFDVDAQRKLAFDFHTALRFVERKGKSALCVPLAKTEPLASGFTRVCGNGVADGTSADVIAVKVRLRDGALGGVYSSPSIMLDAPLSAGSLAKLVIVLAAAQAGIDPESRWCPRQIMDGSRQLRRVGVDPGGYTDAQCARGGKYSVRLVDAIARSDNLAAADVARYLGETRLLAALTVLGFSPEAGVAPWFSTSFGTLPATPRSLLAAWRALVASAYGVELVGSAPRVLAATTADSLIARPFLRLPALSPAAIESLRRLLEAPVAAERGTLGFVADAVTAGKTGTTNSTSIDANGRRTVHAKLALTYQASQGVVNLLVISAPSSGIPLALHDLPASALAPVHRALLQPR